MQNFEVPFAATKYSTYELPVVEPKTWNKAVPFKNKNWLSAPWKLRKAMSGDPQAMWVITRGQCEPVVRFFLYFLLFSFIFFSSCLFTHVWLSVPLLTGGPSFSLLSRLMYLEVCMYVYVWLSLFRLFAVEMLLYVRKIHNKLKFVCDVPELAATFLGLKMSRDICSMTRYPSTPCKR